MHGYVEYWNGRSRLNPPFAQQKRFGTCFALTSMGGKCLKVTLYTTLHLRGYCGRGEIIMRSFNIKKLAGIAALGFAIVAAGVSSTNAQTWRQSEKDRQRIIKQQQKIARQNAKLEQERLRRERRNNRGYNTGTVFGNNGRLGSIARQRTAVISKACRPANTIDASINTTSRTCIATARGAATRPVGTITTVRDICRDIRRATTAVTKPINK